MSDVNSSSDSAAKPVYNLSYFLLFAEGLEVGNFFQRLAWKNKTLYIQKDKPGKYYSTIIMRSYEL